MFRSLALAAKKSFDTLESDDISTSADVISLHVPLAVEASKSTDKSQPPSVGRPFLLLLAPLLLFTAGYIACSLVPSGALWLSIRKGAGGGVGGAVGGLFQVLTMMWLRTAMNYQYRHGGTLRSTIIKLYDEGGVARFYKGVKFALLQAPMSRAGTTFANVAVLGVFSSFAPEVSLGVQTLVSTAVSSLWRIFITPFDTIKTTMQVEGEQGYVLLEVKVRESGLSVLWNGAVGNALAAFAGSYPWFLVFNLLDATLAPSASLLRPAFMGLVATCVSDVVSNSLRVLKTVKQTAAKNISYYQALRLIVAKDGLAGVFCRGLGTRLITNMVQSMLFSVIWKGVEGSLNSGLPTSLPVGLSASVVPTVLVIGGGPAALATLRGFKMLPEGSVDFKAYDRQQRAGGMWTGDRKFSPMYEGMWLNGHHSFTEFTSYTYRDHFHRDMEAYFPRAVVTDYIQGYDRENDLSRHIRPNTDVTSVTFDASREKFVVKSQQIKVEEPAEAGAIQSVKPYSGAAAAMESGSENTEYFDFVVVATGIYSKPNFQPVKGFMGEQLHSRLFIRASEYKGKRVVVVGNGSSGLDMVGLLLKYGVTDVIWSVRNFASKYTERFIHIQDMTSDDVDIRGAITSAEGRTVYFEGDEVVHDVDTIIQATGYDMEGSISFLSDNLIPEYEPLSGESSTRIYDGMLHHGVLLNENPRLVFGAFGYPEDVPTFSLYEFRAEYIAALVSGRIPIPTREQMSDVRLKLIRAEFKLKMFQEEMEGTVKKKEELGGPVDLASEWLDSGYLDIAKFFIDMGADVYAENFIDMGADVYAENWIGVKFEEFKHSLLAEELLYTSAEVARLHKYWEGILSNEWKLWYVQEILLWNYSPGNSFQKLFGTPHDIILRKTDTFSHTKYMDYMTDSGECFLDESKCRPGDRRNDRRRDDGKEIGEIYSEFVTLDKKRLAEITPRGDL
ncbi:hypothetical protein TrST_g11100 [Triparma strigata]|uniref:Flavin-containing monooxygenase n=1 Tax=Triparma strigata TaxID=1606541 RepID=A0A9W7AF59_9STRA|nr:hypothetical protein TrST_g11100 [Triparma strigata]